MTSIVKTLTFIVLITLFSCSEKTKQPELKTGIWQGKITMQQKELPFKFEVFKDSTDYSITLLNSDEKLDLGKITVKNDSVFINMHIFDIEIKAQIKENALQGVYIKNYAENYVLPFSAAFEGEKTTEKTVSNGSFVGKWEMNITNSEGKTTKGIGLFKQENEKLKGTVLTSTGDYRYLEGFTNENTFTLYSFDGNHAFIFEGELENENSFKGEFWSGKTGHYTFTAEKNEHASLPDANKLTYLKENYKQIEFSFPDLNGKKVSLSDEKYKGKVVLLQIFGTWCPNCMDETNFLAPWYEKNKHRDVEIIGLAYEVKDDFNYAKSRIENMKKRLNATYDFLIAGTSKPGDAEKSLPMLNHIMSFPTTIFIDKEGTVRKIHTGFNGPATGEYYDQFVNEFNQFMDTLINEK